MLFKSGHNWKHGIFYIKKLSFWYKNTEKLLNAAESSQSNFKINEHFGHKSAQNKSGTSS